MRERSPPAPGGGVGGVEATPVPSQPGAGSWTQGNAARGRQSSQSLSSGDMQLGNIKKGLIKGPKEKLLSVELPLTTSNLRS